jgi:hypothetical protein
MKAIVIDRFVQVSAERTSLLSPPPLSLSASFIVPQWLLMELEYVTG